MQKKLKENGGVRKGEPIGVAVTIRGDDAVVLIKKIIGRLKETL